MKFSDFELIKETEEGEIIASVFMETGSIFWKRKKRVFVGRPAYSSFFRFLDSGEFTPSFKIENLYEGYRMKKLIN